MLQKICKITQHAKKHMLNVLKFQTLQLPAKKA